MRASSMLRTSISAYLPPTRHVFHSVSIKSLFVEKITKRIPETTFVHSDPGLVKTSTTSDLPIWAKTVSNLAFLHVGPFLATYLEESGERYFFVGFDHKYKAKQEKA
jgi:hypothetical protein